MKIGNAAAAIIFSLFTLSSAGLSQELPRPSARNVTIISIEHDPADSAEVEYIKTNFKFGLYAWLSFSVTTLTPELAWHAPLKDADGGIQRFKNRVRALVTAARNQGIRLHLVLTSGLARNLAVYKEAKVEDLRNCQWYNDNKLAADDQISDPSAMEAFVFRTLSRYARKVRANLEAKTRATQAFLKRVINENPDTLMAVSGWGEAELNFNRIDHAKSVQDNFCDYSPFAVLEFRDWIRHTGEYDDTKGKYKGQGFAEGGQIYQRAGGLARFNADWGTSFSTWDLKYYNWSLTDNWDVDPVDGVNKDPHRIPWSSYVHGRMMPQEGPFHIPGGFDPPRTMQPGVKYWDLWELFRESLVANFVKDAARWASEAGIGADRWFSHQIPADYLYNTNPDVPNKNARFFSSASPLRTADIKPYGGPGATIYDIKFSPSVNPAEYVRTTSFSLPAISTMAPLWAIMEYDAETYPRGLDTAQSDADLILGEYLRVHSFGPYLINFWRWKEDNEHQIKGMNKETALRKFVERIRDKGRVKDLDMVYLPPPVSGATAEYLSQEPAVQLRVNGKIWDGEPWEWKDWGDFSHFEIFRGTEPDFPTEESRRVGTTKDYVYTDTAVIRGQIVYYYKVRAVNVKNEPGPVYAVIGPVGRTP